MNGYLRFGYKNVGYAIDGKETATVRYQLDRQFRTGQYIALRTPGDTVFAIAEVEDLWIGQVRDALEYIEDQGFTHPAATTHGLCRRLNEHYTSPVIRPDDTVTVVGFEVLTMGGGPA